MNIATPSQLRSQSLTPTRPRTRPPEMDSNHIASDTVSLGDRSKVGFGRRSKGTVIIRGKEVHGLKKTVAKTVVGACALAGMVGGALAGCTLAGSVISCLALGTATSQGKALSVEINGKGVNFLKPFTVKPQDSKTAKVAKRVANLASRTAISVAAGAVGFVAAPLAMAAGGAVAGAAVGAHGVGAFMPN